jgi:hypothetical protein
LPSASAIENGRRGGDIGRQMLPAIREISTSRSLPPLTSAALEENQTLSSDFEKFPQIPQLSGDNSKISPHQK